MFLFRFILFLLIFSLVINILRRLFFTTRVHTYYRHENHDPQDYLRHEGDIIIEKGSSKEKKIRSELGEYVKYEELDENNRAER